MPPRTNRFLVAAIETSNRLQAYSARRWFGTSPRLAWTSPSADYLYADRLKDASANGNNERGTRQRKRRRSSPSKALETVLKQKRYWWATPYSRTRRHVDLSYVNAMTVINERLKQEHIREMLQISQRAREPELSLATILAKFVHAANEDASSPAPPAPPSVKLSPAERNLLHEKNYTVEDVMCWNTIISTKDSIIASEQILSHAEEGHEKRLPIFVVLFFLRRIRIDPEALRNVLAYLWLHARPGSVDDSTLFLLMIRLARMARLVMPEALVTISRLFIALTRVGKGLGSESKTARRRSMASRVVARYNKLLDLLSLPSSIRPYLSTVYQQAAQFDLLRHMAEQRPSLPVNREGYNAITRVHLAAAKTDQERDWAHLKADTWPPWKEDKMGFDSEKSPDYGVSRALAAIRHARNAGYGSSHWEDVASILSGWDTDNTPTIQTRAWLLHEKVIPDWRRRSARQREEIWGARIRATRTAQEAWAFFLSYEHDFGPPGQHVYGEMLEKLGAEDRRLANTSIKSDELQDSDVRQLVGGDSREVFPIPSSPREGVYVRTPPPTMDELAEKMYEEKIIPSGRLLINLVSRATSLEKGIKYLQWAAKRDEHSSLRSLLCPTGTLDEGIHQVPMKIYTAFLDLLCTRKMETESEELARAGIEDPVLHALWLLRARAPQYPPAWHVLLRALNSKSKLSDSDKLLGLQVERWSIMLLMRRQMKEIGLSTDLLTFQQMAVGLQHAVVAAWEIQRRHGKKHFASVAYARKIQGAKQFSTAPELMLSGASYARKQFYQLFGTQDARKMSHGSAPDNDLPRLLAQPHGAVLHSYVRTLGLMGQHHLMLEMARWMSQYRREVLAASEMTRSGSLSLRKVVVALRVFCERSWLGPKETAEERLPAPSAATRTTRLKIREVIDENEEVWGQWATDDEVQAYCSAGMLDKLRSMKFT